MIYYMLFAFNFLLLPKFVCCIYIDHCVVILICIIQMCSHVALLIKSVRILFIIICFIYIIIYMLYFRRGQYLFRKRRKYIAVGYVLQ